MISYVKRKQLDVEKYDNCINSASNTRIYAYAFYLDIVADHWDVLVLDDYKAVMPLPWRRKYFIHYIYNPCWTQQLGVFSNLHVDEKMIRKFLKRIPKKFLKVAVQFNSENDIADLPMEKRTNYILDLSLRYNQLYKGYKEVRRRRTDLHNIRNDIILDFDGELEDLIEVFKENNRHTIVEEDYRKLRSVVHFLKTAKGVNIVMAKDPLGNLLGGAVFLIEAKRITYLFSSNTKLGRASNVMTLVIDAIVKKYARSNQILDFEGSMIPGIAFFFKSFGAKKEIYKVYTKNLFFK